MSGPGEQDCGQAPGQETDSELLLLEAWVADNPGSRLFLRLAQAYRRRGRLADAAQVLERGLVLRPGELEARELLAQVREEMGDAEGAVDQLLAAARELARHVGVYQRLADLWAARGLDEDAAWARKVARLLARSLPESGARKRPSQDTPTMAEIYAEQGHYRQAMAIYRKLLEQEPGNQKWRARLEELKAQAAATGGPAETGASREDDALALEEMVGAAADLAEGLAAGPAASPELTGAASQLVITRLEALLQAAQRRAGAA